MIIETPNRCPFSWESSPNSARGLAGQTFIGLHQGLLVPDKHHNAVYTWFYDILLPLFG